MKITLTHLCHLRNCVCVFADSGVSGEGEYYNYNNYYQDPAYQQY